MTTDFASAQVSATPALPAEGSNVGELRRQLRLQGMAASYVASPDLPLAPRHHPVQRLSRSVGCAFGVLR
jgi:hypothetical protein